MKTIGAGSKSKVRIDSIKIANTKLIYSKIKQENNTMEPLMISNKDRQNNTITKFEGFDFLRAIFSIVIVAYKTKIFYLPKIVLASGFTYALSDYILSGMLGALAVPTFFQISLFIFYLKSENSGLKYFIQKRLPRLLSLYLFWVILITTFDVIFVDKFSAIKGVNSLKSLILFVVSGHDTPYFFFFSLVFTTIITEILIIIFARVKKASKKFAILYCLLFLSSVLVFTFSAVDPIIGHMEIQSNFLKNLNNLTHWDYNPLNFLPYIFTAVIAAQEYNEEKLRQVTFLKRKCCLLLALTLLFFALEWNLTSNYFLIQVDQSPLDHYMRLSLVFGSWLLLYLSLLIKSKAPTIVQFLSKCSLGIYGFHVFFIFKGHLFWGEKSFFSYWFQTVAIFQICVAFLVTLVGAIALTLLFKRVEILKAFVWGN
jgi:Acyltransferase family